MGSYNFDTVQEEEFEPGIELVDTGLKSIEPQTADPRNRWITAFPPEPEKEVKLYPASPELDAPTPDPLSGATPRFKGSETGGVTKKDIVNSPEYMKLVDEQLRLLHGERWRVGSPFNKMSADERFEIWQGLNRKIKVGNSVTTANVALQYYKNMTEEEQQTFGEGLVLFDSMTGKGDFLDATKDYISGAIVDPVTLLSMGFGKAFSQPAAKASTTLIRASALQAMKKELAAGATKEMAREAAQKAFKQATATFLKGKAWTAAKMSVLDIGANIGTDVVEQNIRIDSGAQEDYSYLQTVVSGGLSIGIPVIVGVAEGTRALSRTKALEDTIAGSTAKVLDEYNMDPVALRMKANENIDIDQVNKSFTGLFAGIKEKDLKNRLHWDEAKAIANGLIDESGIPVSVGQKEATFFEIFLKGTKDQAGLFEEMVNAGARFHPEAYLVDGEKAKFTQFTADLVDRLDDEVIDKAVRDFEEVFGDLPENFPRTAEAMSSAIIARSSGSGTAMETMSFGRRVVQDANIDRHQKVLADLAEEEAVKTADARRRVVQFSQGIWKKLLTSHISTTAANVKGWSALYAINTPVDFMQGALYLGIGGISKLAGKEAAAEAAYQASINSVHSGVRRLVNLVNPLDAMETAKKLLETDPKVRKELFRYLSGDSGFESTLKAFGFEDSRLARGAEAISDFTQKVTAVKLQDELTKNFSFASAAEGFIYKKYGVPPSEFFKRDDWYKVITSKDFHDGVMAPALDRALRETGGKSFYKRIGNIHDSPVQALANAIERLSTAPGSGFLIPFGRFFNTTVAFTSDFAGLTLAKRAITRAWHGKTGLEAGAKDKVELWADTVVGWGLGLAYYNEALEKVDKGIAWNQTEDPNTGEIIDHRFDWPMSTFMLIGQIYAHKVKHGKVPPELAIEASDVLFKNTFEDLGKFGKLAYSILDATTKTEGGEVSGELLTFFKESGARVISGAMRPLDPLNEVSKLALGRDTSGKDRRDNYWAQSLRYVDVFFDSQLDTRTPSTRPTNDPDYGKQLGTRFSGKQTLTEIIQNSLGKQPWRTTQWKGPPEVKNRLDEIFFVIMEEEMNTMLENEPDYFSLPVGARERKYKIALGRAREEAREFFAGDTSEEGELLILQERIEKIDEDDLEFARKLSGITADTDELLNSELGRESLNLLLDLAEDVPEIQEDWE